MHPTPDRSIASPCLVTARRRPLAATLSLLALLTGCGGGSGGGGGDTGSSGSRAGGNVVKGLLADAVVDVRPLVNGVAGAVIASVRTDSSGRYLATLPGDASPPFLVEARSDSTTRMRCDLLPGCGPANGDKGDSNKNGVTDFGEWGPAPALTLTALASTRDMLASLDITPFTHLAARHAATAPQGQDAVSAELTLSQTARALGLQTSLGSLKAFDIFAPPPDATLEQWHYSLLCAAIASVASTEAGISTLGPTLGDFAQGFAADGGQFRLKDGATPGLSLEGLFTVAQSLAQRLKPEAATLFSTRLAELQQAGDGDLTDATPDSSAGQETLAKVDAFLADWRQWRTEYPLPDAGAPLNVVRTDSFQPDLDAHWVLARSLAALSTVAPQTTQPTLLMRSACSALTNSLYRVICNSLAGSPRNLCLLNLSINGETLCNYLTHIRIPAPAGLIAQANVFEGTATLGGTLAGYVVDLRVTPGTTTDKSIQMSLGGTLSGENHLWAVSNGSITFDYAEVISSANLRNPDPVKAQFTLDHSAEIGAGLVSGQFNATVTMDAGALNDLEDASDITVSLPQVNLQWLSTGRFSTPLEGEASVSLTGISAPLIRMRQPVVVASTGLATTITLEGAPSRWSSGLLDSTASWAEGSLAGSYTGAVVEVRGDGDMRAVLPESPGQGSLYLGQQRVGTLTLEGTTWLIKRPDFTQEPL
jgi:hypothetical protein